MSRWAWVLVASLLVAGRAHAQDALTTELGAWPATVAALQSDTTAQGRSLAVCVGERGTCLPCGRYTIALDAAGMQAFVIGACDAATGRTRITLADRSALFDHTHAVPQPRAVALRAGVVHDVVSRGGAADVGGSTLGCTALVRPFLRDLEHGGVVYLGPDAYDLRTRRADVAVSANGTTWLLASDAHVTASVDYDVVERSSGSTVLAGHASLECAQEVRTAGAPPARGTDDSRFGELQIESDVQAVVFVDGDERGLTPLTVSLAAGPHEVRAVPADGVGQEQLIVVRRASRARMVCHFAPPTPVRPAPRPSPRPAIVFDPWTVEVLHESSTPRECDADSKIAAGRETDGHGSCTGMAPSPEVRPFTLRGRARVFAALVNEFGGALVLRHAGGGSPIEVGTTEGLHGTASIDRWLPAGRYELVIETPEAEAGRYRLAWAFARE